MLALFPYDLRVEMCRAFVRRYSRISVQERGDVKHTHKQPGGSDHRCKHERLIARQERAEARLQERKTRSVQHQLALLKVRPGESRKERSRLNRKVA